MKMKYQGWIMSNTFSVVDIHQSRWDQIRNLFGDNAQMINTEIIQCPINLRRDSIKLDSNKICFVIDSTLPGQLEIVNHEIYLNFDAKLDQKFQISLKKDVDIDKLRIKCFDTQKQNGQTTSINFIENVIKQKVIVNEMPFLMQPVYGKHEETEIQKECVICLSSLKDCIVLPCRHFCLCLECAESLRKQSNKCPICRADSESILYLEITEKD